MSVIIASETLHRIKILSLLLSLVVASAVAGLSSVHAGGYPGGYGTVCLADAAGLTTSPAPGPGNPCQTSPYMFNSPYPPSPQLGPTQIRVGVYINGSDGFGGFTIIINATHTVLAASGVDLSGSILQPSCNEQNPSTCTIQVFAECLDGVLVKGPACSGADGLDTLDLSASVPLGSGNTAAPSTGLLFTAIFNVTGTAPSGGVPISFQQSTQFCSGSSTTQAGLPGDYCVSVTKPPSTTPIAEGIQTGTTFDNHACSSTCSLPWVAVSSNVSSITVIQGAATGNGFNITATPENGWPGASTDSITFTSVVTPNSFSAPFSSPMACSPKGTLSPSCPVTVSASTATAGTYTITIYGTYVSFVSGVSVTLVGK